MFWTRPVNADSSVTISAFIAPVRYVLVNASHKIVEIDTNTTGQVNPVVELASNQKQIVPLDNYIKSQYSFIMSNCLGGQKYGVVYNGECRAKVANNQPSWEDRQLSVIFKFI